MTKNEMRYLKILSFSMAFVFMVGLFIYQNNRIQKLQNSLENYEELTEYYDEYMDLVEVVYEGKINEAVLKERIYWLEKKQHIDISVENINVGIGEFIGINAYGNGKTYMVVLVENEELETINLGNYIYVMGEDVIVVKLDDIYYSIPLSKL